MNREILNMQRRKQDVNSLLHSLMTDISRGMVDYGHDVFLFRKLENWRNKLQQVLSKVQKDPRFDWMLIQAEMDELYLRDKSLTGYLIRIIIGDPEELKWAKLEYQIRKQSNEKRNYNN